MSYKKTVNYSKVMKAPTTFKIAFWKINLPWTFKLETTMLYVFSFLVVQLFFHFPLKWLGGLINNIDKVGAFGLPYLLTVYLIGQPTDGKPIFYFVKDTIVYFLMEKLPKKKYCQEEVVEWMDETIEFSELKVERRKGVELNGEVNFTAKNDSREFIVNK